MLRRIVLTVGLSLAGAGTASAQVQHVPAPPKLEYDSVAFGRQLTQWLLYAEIDSLWAYSDTSLQRAYGTKEQWLNDVAQFASFAGQEYGLVEERFVQRLGNRQYWRFMRMSEFTSEPIALRWVLRPGKKTSGYGVNPMSQLPPVDP
jgi:hypothetical protein